MSHHVSHPIHTHCQNCEKELSGPYCDRCGQKDVDFHRSFGHVLHDLLETWLHLDHSFFQGVYNMLFRLGKTTREFNAGKRARHVPPFRFYLVVSLFFFFLVFPSQQALENKYQAKKRENNAVAAAEGTKTPFARTLDAAITKKLEHPGSAVASILHGIPKALLVSLPLFALLTRVLYRKRGYFYIEHLILAFNLHSFVFLWGATVYGWSKILALTAPVFEHWVLGAAALFGIWTYYQTLKVVFERSWTATLVLGTICAGAYAFVLFNVISVATLIIILL